MEDSTWQPFVRQKGRKTSSDEFSLANPIRFTMNGATIAGSWAVAQGLTTDMFAVILFNSPRQQIALRFVTKPTDNTFGLSRPGGRDARTTHALRISVGELTRRRKEFGYTEGVSLPLTKHGDMWVIEKKAKFED